MEEKENVRAFRTRNLYAFFASFLVNTLYWLLGCILCMIDGESVLEVFLFIALFVVQIGGYCYFQWRYKGKSLLEFNVIYFFFGVGVSVLFFIFFEKMLRDVFLGGMALVVISVIYVIIVFCMLIVRVFVALIVSVRKNAAENAWEKACAGYAAILILCVFLIWLWSTNH